MGLLDHLWDDTVAGPRPENGLGKLRKHHTFSFRPSSGNGTPCFAILCRWLVLKKKKKSVKRHMHWSIWIGSDLWTNYWINGTIVDYFTESFFFLIWINWLWLDQSDGGTARSYGEDSPEDAVKVTRSIMIIKPPGYQGGSAPVSPAGSTPPVSPFSGESLILPFKPNCRWNSTLTQFVVGYFWHFQLSMWLCLCRQMNYLVFFFFWQKWIILFVPLFANIIDAWLVPLWFVA